MSAYIIVTCAIIHAACWGALCGHANAKKAFAFGLACLVAGYLFIAYLFS